MPNFVEFLVGEHYENRKGIYEVLEVHGDDMRIRWESGEEVDTTVIIQSHIIETMQRELVRITNENKVTAPVREGAAPNGWHRIRR